MIFRSTTLYSDVISGRLQNIAQKERDIMVTPILLGDGAFPFHPWLMKPYSHASLKAEKNYFSYRLSRACMVTEGALLAS